MSTVADQYGVFGHPVNHSLSPFIHGLFARELGQQMSYRAFDVKPEEFHERVADFFAQGGRGLNITLPHKIAAVDAAHELTARAAHAAAVNTLALKGDLCHNLGLVITHRRVLMIGAGGATRGVLAPILGLEPALLVIANRTPERAAALAAAFSDLGATQGVGFEDVEAVPFDLILNATSASLSGEMPPLPAGVIGPQTVCYDLAYGKSATAFVRWAAGQGCARALQGLGMLVEQAAESFRLWRGVRPSTVRVLDALRERAGGAYL
jgi:shikimate dehydrogenase